MTVGKQFTWYRNEKHGNVCKSCLEELDKQGELWDDFFITWNYNPGAVSGESGFGCRVCSKSMIKRQLHKEENDRLTLNHNCQPECSRGYTKCGGSMTWLLLSRVKRNGNKRFSLSVIRCPDCEIKRLKENNAPYNKIKEVENVISGKGNDNNNQERERERVVKSKLSPKWNVANVITKKTEPKLMVSL